MGYSMLELVAGDKCGHFEPRAGNHDLYPPRSVLRSGLIMHMDKPACASNRFYAIPVSPYSTIKRVRHDC